MLRNAWLIFLQFKLDEQWIFVASSEIKPFVIFCKIWKYFDIWITDECFQWTCVAHTNFINTFPSQFLVKAVLNFQVSFLEEKIIGYFKNLQKIHAKKYESILSNIKKIKKKLWGASWVLFWCFQDTTAFKWSCLSQLPSYRIWIKSFLSSPAFQIWRNSPAGEQIVLWNCFIFVFSVWFIN